MAKIIKARGLPWSATATEVMEFFSSSNVVGGESGVHFLTTYDGRPAGACYVELESQEDLDSALEMNKKNMGKRYIEVYEASRDDMDGDLSKGKNTGGSGDGDDDAVVKLRGLPFSATKQDVMDFFGGLEIESNGVLMINDFQGRPKGECYVQFTTTAGSTKGLEKNKSNMGHRYIEVFPSTMDEARNAQSQMSFAGPPMRGGRGGPGGPMRGGMGMRPSPYERMGGGGGMGGYGGGMGGYGGGMGGGRGGYGGGMGGRGGYGGGMGMGGGRGGPRGGSTLKMRGLPFRVTEQEIAEWFSSVADPIDIQIKYNHEGRPSGEAAVTFGSEAEAKNALQKDKQNMQHRYIELFFDRF